MPQTIVVRPVEGPTELDTFFALAAQTFVRDVPGEVAGPDWRRFMLEHPGFHPAGLRGAFQDATYVGGYILEERRLCVGSARLRAGCIGAVVTHPDHRRQGIGSALMWDAIEHARARGLTLLLLNGAAHFYDPFGYVDVFDRVEHLIACSDVLAQPASPYRVRLATPDDAEALLALYRRHYGPFTGSFDRTLDEQVHLTRFAHEIDATPYATGDTLPYGPPVLAVDAQGEPHGYVTVPWGPLRSFGSEAAADDWAAALALLHYHARRLGELTSTPRDLRWPLSPAAPTYYAIADHLSVRSESRTRPHAGWMACAVDVPGSLRALLPLWQERVERSRVDAEPMVMAVEGNAITLGGAGRIGSTATAAGHIVRVEITRAALIQLLFGFRPVSWVARQQGQTIPLRAVPILDALFPLNQGWIAPTDGC